MLFVKIRVQEMFKEFPVQIAKIIRNAKFITVFIVLLKQHAKIVLAYVGGKIVSYNPLKTLASFMINNSCFQHLDHRKEIAIICNVDVNLNNLNLERIANSLCVAAFRQRIHTIIDHAEGAAHVG